MNSYHRFIVNPNCKWNSIMQTTTYIDPEGVERVNYTGYLLKLEQNQTLKEYLAENPGFYVIDEKQLDERIARMEADRCEAVHKIDKSRYWEMLDVLPPGKWDGTSFYCTERLTGNLVSWFVEINGEYFETTDQATRSNTFIVEKVKDARARGNV